MINNKYVYSNVYCNSVQPVGTGSLQNSDTVIYYFPACGEIENKRIKSIIFIPRDRLRFDKNGSAVIGTMNRIYLNLIDVNGNCFLQDCYTGLFNMAGEMLNIFSFSNKPVIDWNKSFLRIVSLTVDSTDLNIPFVVDYE